jgi:hypothetical protein
MTTKEIFDSIISVKKHKTHNERIKAFIRKCKTEHIHYAIIVSEVSSLFHVSEVWVKDFYYREGLHKED